MAGFLLPLRGLTPTRAADRLARVATNVFLGLVSRSLDAEQYGLFSGCWSIALIVGFGLSRPVEQELARLGGGSVPPGPAGRAGIRVALETAGVALIVLVAVSPVLVAMGVTVEVL